MKRLFILISFAFISASPVQAQWHEYYTGVTEDLYDIFCIDENTAFVCGENGVILKTGDGGETWVEKNRTEGVWLYDIRFIGNVGYASGKEILKTTDGGESWQKIWPESDEPEGMLRDHFFVQSEDLFLVDTDTLYRYYGCIEKSVDSGVNWDGLECFIPFGGETSKMFFEDNVGYVATSTNGTIAVYKSTDYGQTWEMVWGKSDLEDFPWGFAVHFIDRDNMKIFPSTMLENNKDKAYDMVNFTMITTNDGFETVNIETVENNGYFGNIVGSKFTDANTGCYIAYEEDWFGCKGCEDKYYIEEQNFACITKDGGLTWQFCYDGIDGQKSLYGIDGIDTIFYITAAGGYVYRTGAPETIYEWYDEIGYQSIDEKDNPIYVTPNPFSDRIKINGEISSTITLVDVTGNVLYEKQVRANKHEINTSQYPSGFYTLRVCDKDGKEIVKKMVKTEK